MEIPKVSGDKLIRFAWAVMIGLFVILMVFVTWLPEEKTTINSIAGTYEKMFILIIGYFFGSSDGSAKKNEMLKPKI